MNLVRAFAAAVPALLLSACALVPQRPPAAAFDMVGRVLVSGEGRAFSSGLRWKHDAALDELWLLSPVGQTLAHIAADDGGAVLTTPDQQEYRAFSVESLTRRALGWSLPLAELRFWIMATPAPGEPAAGLTRDPAGRISTIDQNGWRISYVYPEAPATLPRRLDLTRGEQQIRLVIDSWRGGDAP